MPAKISQQGIKAHNIIKKLLKKTIFHTGIGMDRNMSDKSFY